jgi:hypothetical protein
MTARERTTLRAAITTGTQHDRERIVLETLAIADRRAAARQARKLAKMEAERKRRSGCISMQQFWAGAQSVGGGFDR